MKLGGTSLTIALSLACAARSPGQAQPSMPSATSRGDAPDNVSSTAARAASVDGDAPSRGASPATASTPRGPCAAPTPTEVTATTSECPNVAGLRVVHRWDVGETTEACGPPRWVMFSLLIRSDGGGTRYFPPGDRGSEPSAPRFRQLTDNEVRGEGLAPTRDPLWVFSGDDAAPCQATLGAWWAARTHAGGQEYVEIGRAIHGCELPDDGPARYALSSPARPVACRYRSMPDVRPSRLFPPPQVRARITMRVCTPPRCTITSRRAALTIQGGTVDDTQAAYIFRSPDRPECSSPHDWYHVVAWTPYLGAPWVRLLNAGPVTGVFYDGRGIRSVVTDEVGTLRAYATERDDIGSLYASQEFEWYAVHEEEYARWRISPSCL